MKTNRFLALVVLCVVTATFQMAMAQEHPAKAEHPAKPALPSVSAVTAPVDGILAVATGAGDFSTFLAAVEAAGLTDKFNDKGPITVFAPTNEAFAKLPDGTVDELLKPANKAKLAGILACHVVPGKIMAEDLKTMKATNVNGQDLDIKVTDGGVTVDGAHVVKADMVASNGVIHAIDTVIIPSDTPKAKESAAPKDHPAH